MFKRKISVKKLMDDLQKQELSYYDLLDRNRQLYTMLVLSAYATQVRLPRGQH